LDDWLGPWISFLWLLFLIGSVFAVRMLYKTYIKFRDAISRRTEEGYIIKDDVAYETENALGCRVENSLEYCIFGGFFI